jgi:hypothetical protein
VTAVRQPAIRGPGRSARLVDPEATRLDKPSFVYKTYIQTTPERLRQALTEPAFTERYWAITFDSDWKPDSIMTWHTRGLTIAGPEQVVLETGDTLPDLQQNTPTRLGLTQ